MKTIYEEIADERTRQNEKWGGEDHDDSLGYLEWIHYVVKHATMAGDGYVNARGTRRALFRKQMIRVAALAVAAIEAVDRHRGVKAAGGDSTGVEGT